MNAKSLYFSPGSLSTFNRSSTSLFLLLLLSFSPLFFSFLFSSNSHQRANVYIKSRFMAHLVWITVHTFYGSGSQDDILRSSTDRYAMVVYIQKFMYSSPSNASSACHYHHHHRHHHRVKFRRWNRLAIITISITYLGNFARGEKLNILSAFYYIYFERLFFCNI